MRFSVKLLAASLFPEDQLHEGRGLCVLVLHHVHSAMSIKGAQSLFVV